MSKRLLPQHSSNEDSFEYEEDYNFPEALSEQCVTGDPVVDDRTKFEDSTFSGAASAVYKVISLKDVESVRDACVRELVELLESISEDEALSVLVKYSWNEEKVQEDWFGRGEQFVRKSVGLGEDYREGGAKYNQGMCEKCPVCLENERVCGISLLGCGDKHFVCRPCYKQYLEVKITDGRESVLARCPMFRCSSAVPVSLVRSLVDPAMWEKYSEWLSLHFVSCRGDLVKFCPNPVSCQNLALLRGAYDSYSCTVSVDCVCGFTWCFACSFEVHVPVSCACAKIWTEKNSSESENVSWIVANTKPCPKCRKPIEKNQGCNHMTCPAGNGGCGTNFCWMCLKLWENHGSNGGYYSCNLYQKQKEEKDKDLTSAERARENAKNALDRYMFYYGRFVNHLKSGLVARKELVEEIPKHCEWIHDNLGVDMAELTFLEQALRQVIECRSVLKWTYVASFYDNPSNDTKPFSSFSDSSSQLFAYNQKNLEEFTDRLHEFVEKDFARDFLNSESLHDKPLMRDKFFEFKSNVSNYTSVTRKFCFSIVN